MPGLTIIEKLHIIDPNCGGMENVLFCISALGNLGESISAFLPAFRDRVQKEGRGSTSVNQGFQAAVRCSVFEAKS